MIRIPDLTNQGFMGCQPRVLLPLLICATPGRSTLDMGINSGPTFDWNAMGIKNPTHRIHGAGIFFAYIYPKFRPNVGTVNIPASPMDPMRCGIGLMTAGS